MTDTHHQPEFIILAPGDAGYEPPPTKNRRGRYSPQREALRKVLATSRAGQSFWVPTAQLATTVWLITVEFTKANGWRFTRRKRTAQQEPVKGPGWRIWRTK